MAHSSEIKTMAQLESFAIRRGWVTRVPARGGKERKTPRRYGVVSRFIYHRAGQCEQFTVDDLAPLPWRVAYSNCASMVKLGTLRITRRGLLGRGSNHRTRTRFALNREIFKEKLPRLAKILISG